MMMMGYDDDWGGSYYGGDDNNDDGNTGTYYDCWIEPPGCGYNPSGSYSPDCYSAADETACNALGSDCLYRTATTYQVIKIEKLENI